MSLTASSNKESFSDDLFLLEQLSNGDREAYTKVYNNHVPKLYRFVFAFTRSKQDAEEIVQEVFVRIWQRRESLVGMRSFEAYMYSMAKNLLIDLHRRRKHLDRIVSDLSDKKEDYYLTQDEIIYKEYHKAALEAISKLSDRRRQVFILRTQQGLRLEEIAGEMKMSVSGVKKHLYQATQFIKAYLIQHGDLSLLLILCLLY